MEVLGKDLFQRFRRVDEAQQKSDNIFLNEIVSKLITYGITFNAVAPRFSLKTYIQLPLVYRIILFFETQSQQWVIICCHHICF